MLTLYAHPLSSFCWKALIALYENDTPFEIRRCSTSSSWAAPEMAGRAHAALLDSDRKQFVPEATIISSISTSTIAAAPASCPTTPTPRATCGLWDRFFDLYLQVPMQKIVGDRIRPTGAKDPHGVDEARRLIATSYDVLEKQLGERQFAVGDSLHLGRLRRGASALLRRQERAARRPSRAWPISSG